ncbi:uncharacterized protein LOC144451783 [Glandiceps talaboti]
MFRPLSLIGSNDKDKLLIESYRRAHFDSYSGRERFVVNPQNISLISMKYGDLAVVTDNDHLMANRSIVRVNHYKTGYSAGTELDAGMRRFIPQVKAYLCRRLGHCT